jgi:hypothetical protein
MASTNKKKKLKNSHLVPSGLKTKAQGMKRLSFFTAALRQQEKRELKKLDQE